MSYVIHGTTGAQGAPLLALLLAANRAALAAVRDPGSAQGSPAIQVDNGSVESLIAAYTGADGVFVHLPQGAEPARLEQANNIAEAVRRRPAEARRDLDQRCDYR